MQDADVIQEVDAAPPPFPKAQIPCQIGNFEGTGFAGAQAQ